MSQLSAVFDTNVWFAAKLTDGLARRVVRLIVGQRIQAVTSQLLLDELMDLLTIKESGDIHGYMGFVASLCRIVPQPLPDLPAATQRILRDPADAPVITTAMAGSVALIVTLDRDLLTLKSVKDIGIVHSQTLLHILGEE